MRWDLQSAPNPPAWILDAIRSFPPEIQALLVRQNFPNRAALDAYLQPRLDQVEAPESFPHLMQAVQWVHQACCEQQPIAIVSDYDVDGITSMALMHRFFKALHFHFTPIFPLRGTEGYGLSEALAARILKTHKPFHTLIAMDCGTNSIEPVQQLHAAGMHVIIIDHHQHTCDALPTAQIINPQVDPAHYSIAAQQLCTAGLVFKWLHAWLKCLKAEGAKPAANIKLRTYLDLVALGTIADIVPLQHENRILVHFGLRELSKTAAPGLQALLEVSHCSQTAPLQVEDVAFNLAPRVNASGRLDSAKRAFQLLIEEDPAQARTLAQQLDTLNQQRKALERSIAAEAEQLISAHPNQRAHVLYSPHWHPGVIGIVAGRLASQHHCPVFVLSQQHGQAKGSARTIPGINLMDLFQAAHALNLQWGGHPNAAGLTLPIDQIGPLEQCFNAYLEQTYPSPPEPILSLAGILPETQLTDAFLMALDRLAPFGQGNPMPLWALQNITIESAECFGASGAHVRLKWRQQAAIGWNKRQHIPPCNQPIDLAIQLRWNHWQHRRILQIQWIDWRHHLSNF